MNPLSCVRGTNADLPSCGHRSHIPDVTGLNKSLSFAAAGNTKAQYAFTDQRRKLQISAIELDKIQTTGIAVGTFCASQDYLTAFLQWRALLLDILHVDNDANDPVHESFCRTLCLGQVPLQPSQEQSWPGICYYVFSSLIREKLPRLYLGPEMNYYADMTGLIPPQMRRWFLQEHFGNRMTGRSFCITDKGLLGMGSGYMIGGDIVVVPLGCSTPILLRPDGRPGEYRYVGDVYIDGYMHGEAVEELEAGLDRVVSEYILC